MNTASRKLVVTSRVPKLLYFVNTQVNTAVYDTSNSPAVVRKREPYPALVQQIVNLPMQAFDLVLRGRYTASTTSAVVATYRSDHDYSVYLSLRSVREQQTCLAFKK